ncbi:MAG: hypothetical protein NQU42_04890 [Methanothrix sp.]|uniref:4Fe-4S domain-containing protein n=1 Tax=Methanothrix sp. TaxID=90426 RepID=UPI0025F14C52|nr:hypothetical protein [Methanothrix sp.]MCQ8903411.1 hypothetical protein [Methanothrix sp.]
MKVDERRCIGCRACSAISRSISISEDAGIRSITFHSHDESLTERLIEACPAGAISSGITAESITLTFRMKRCSVCGEPFATEREIEHVASLIPETHKNWLDLCPECRRAEQRRSHAWHCIRIRGRV